MSLDAPTNQAADGRLATKTTHGADIEELVESIIAPTFVGERNSYAAIRSRVHNNWAQANTQCNWRFDANTFGTVFCFCKANLCIYGRCESRLEIAGKRWVQNNV